MAKLVISDSLYLPTNMEQFQYFNNQYGLSSTYWMEIRPLVAKADTIMFFSLGRVWERKEIDKLTRVYSG